MTTLPVSQLVLESISPNAWRMCDRTIAGSDAANVVAYIEFVEDRYEVTWLIAGSATAEYDSLEQVFEAAVARLRRRTRPSTKPNPIPHLHPRSRR